MDVRFIQNSPKDIVVFPKKTFRFQTNRFDILYNLKLKVTNIINVFIFFIYILWISIILYFRNKFKYLFARFKKEKNEYFIILFHKKMYYYAPMERSGPDEYAIIIIIWRFKIFFDDFIWRKFVILQSIFRWKFYPKI